MQYTKNCNPKFKPSKKRTPNNLQYHKEPLEPEYVKLGLASLQSAYFAGMLPVNQAVCEAERYVQGCVVLRKNWSWEFKVMVVLASVPYSFVNHEFLTTSASISFKYQQGK